MGDKFWWVGRRFGAKVFEKHVHSTLKRHGRGGGRGGGRLALNAVLCTEAVCRLKPLLTQLADLDALSDVFLTSLFLFSLSMAETGLPF